jgi:hypothetical protein
MPAANASGAIGHDNEGLVCVDFRIRRRPVRTGSGATAFLRVDVARGRANEIIRGMVRVQASPKRTKAG